MISSQHSRRLRVAPAILSVAFALAMMIQPAAAGNAFRSASSTSVTSGSPTVVKPAGTAAGDILIAAVAVRPDTATITPPAGWALVRQLSNSNATANLLAVYYKAATAAEGASYAWVLGANTGADVGVMAFSGCDTNTPIDLSAGQNTPLGFQHAAPSITPDVNGSMIVTWHCYASSNPWTPPAGMTEDVDVSSVAAPSTAGMALSGNHLLQTSAAATGVLTATTVNDANVDVGNAVSLALRPANIAPVLDNSKTPALATVSEDPGAPSGAVGTLVSSLVDFAAPAGQVDNVTDADAGASLGIAVTAVDSNGTGYYSLNGGTTWTAFGAVSGASARLLAADADNRIYFQPNQDLNGTFANAFTFRAWDQTSGTDGGTANTTTNGGSTAFSAATDGISQTVTAVNDAPTATNLSAPETYTEDTTLNLVDILASDVDSSTVTATLTLSITAAGSLTTATSGAVTSTYNAGTGVWTASGAIADVNILLAGVSFVPAPNYNSSFTIATSVSDGSLSATGTKTVTGTAVNDAPTATNLNAAQTYVEDTPLALTAIVVSDVDNATTTVTLTLSTPTAGSLTTGTSGAVTSTYNTGTGVWTASGAIASVNTLLAGVSFVPALNYNSSFTIATSVADGSGGVIGGTKNMTGTAVNDSPTAANLSAAETYTEDTTLNLVDIVVSDVDSSTVTATLTLSTTAAGNLTTATAGSTTSTYNAGTGMWTASGPLSEVNILLAGVSFAPALNYNSSFTIATSVSDGSLSVTGTKTVTGTAVNDAPTATNLSAAETYTEDTTLNLIDIVASDVDSSTITATLTLSAAAAGSLTTATSGTTTSTFNAGTGTWTASGPLAEVNALLAGVSFVPAVNYNASFTIATSVSDGALSVTGTKVVTGTAVNDPPSATNLSAAETYIEDTALNLVDIVVTDPDSVVTATLTLSNPSAGSLSTATAGAVTSIYNAGTGVWTAAGAVADVNALLAGVTFTPAANFNSNFTIATSVSDGVAPAVTGTKAVTGTAVNDAPTATNLSTAETYTEDTTLNLVDIVVSDVDSATITATLTLSSPSAGSLTTSTSGAVTSTYNGGTGVWTASGAIANVNTLLAGVSFVPAANFNASFTIATGVSDGSLSATGTKNVTGIAVNDAPTATNLSAAELYTEDTTLNLVDIVVSDVDSASVTATLTLSNPSAGSLTTGTSGAVTSAYTPATGVWSASGAIANVNALLAGVSLVPAANYNATFTITTSVSDGIAAPITGTKLMSGTAINDAPVLDASAVPALISVSEDASVPTGPVGTPVADLVGFVGGGGMENVTDIDAGALLGIAIVGASTTGGSWFYTTDGGSTWAALGAVSITSARLLAANPGDRIYFQPSPNVEGAQLDVLTFRAWDQTSGLDGGLVSTASNGGSTAFSSVTDTASIYVIPVNDAPVLDASKNPTLNPINEDAPAPVGAVGTLVASLVDFATPSGQVDNVNDVDSGALLGIAVTGADAANGTWYYSLDGGSFWNPLGTVSGSAARLLAADASTRLYFQPNANFSGTLPTAITFRAWDRSVGANGDVAVSSPTGGTTAFSTATDTAGITITSVNDAPVLDTSKSPALNSINEDALAPAGAVGTLVSSLVDFAIPSGQLDNVTDLDSGAVLGIAITGANAANGTWYYSVNNGASWSALGAPSDSSARVLAANASNRVYFQPNSDFNGTLASAITFRAWDQSSGTDGSVANASVNGGTTAFSIASDTASLVVNPLNDAPVLDASKSPVLASINADAGAPTGPVGTLVASLVDFAIPSGQLDNVTDADSGAVLGIAVTAADSNFTWYFSVDGGSTWGALGPVSASSARLLAANAGNRVYAQPNTRVTGSFGSALTFRAWDQTSGSNGSLADTSPSGGTSAFSLVMDTAGIGVLVPHCSPGYYSADGLEPGVPAPPGYYVPGPGATNPTPAAIGYYVPGYAATNQIPAPVGGYCPVMGMRSPILAGDLDGDSLVSQTELDAAYGNYITNSPWLFMTNVAGLGGTNVTFAVSNVPAVSLTVEFSTDLVNWTNLGLASPRYLFTDTNAPAVPQRSYRLRFP